MSTGALRPAAAADADAIAGCVEAAYAPWVEGLGQPPGPMLDDYSRVVRDHRVWVIEREGEIVGAAVLIEREEGLLLDNVAVPPARQGEGIGGRLIRHIEAEARRLGHAHIDLYAHERMTGNIALYARYGYEKIDRRTERGFSRVYVRKRL